MKNFFGYSRKEAIGFSVLFTILVLAMLLPLLFDRLFTSEAGVSAHDARMLDSLISLLEERSAPQYFDFDPNLIPDDSMYLLGLRPSVVETWQNYRKSGGTFSQKSDFRKIYGITEQDYLALSPFILLPEGSEKSPKSSFASAQKSTDRSIDINIATAADLLFIKGIGVKLSERIIKFRDLLGGYTRESQFDQVYYLEGEALQNLKDGVFISDNYQPKKINLNTSGYKEIIKHPYIDKEITDGIFKIRHSADSIVTREKFKDLLAAKDSLFMVLSPYVDF